MKEPKKLQHTPRQVIHSCNTSPDSSVLSPLRTAYRRQLGNTECQYCSREYAKLTALWPPKRTQKKRDRQPQTELKWQVHKKTQLQLRVSFGRNPMISAFAFLLRHLLAQAGGQVWWSRRLLIARVFTCLGRHHRFHVSHGSVFPRGVGGRGFVGRLKRMVVV
ncbi:hypothetical protein NC651_019048 [Populus alba x Populus x berolinensis]|nr:hypothetical protein NC651_019048 [Populus alba x Populus x berolinensis]